MRATYLPTVAELQAFSACARLGATTRAAQELNLTQSAISRSIATLEDRLGTRLFHRERQRLLLSDAGRALLPGAEHMLADLAQSALTVMSFGGHSQVLRLAMLPTLANVWLLPRLPLFQRAVPDITFDIAARLNSVDFDREPFDAAIQRGPHRPPDALVETLMSEQLVVVAAPALLGTDFLDDAAIAGLPLLQQATRPGLWLSWFNDAGLDPRTVLRGARFDHFDMVVTAAKAGMGVAIVPELLVRPDLLSGDLLLASRRRLLGTDPYSLIYPRRSLSNESFAAFRLWLLELAASEAEFGALQQK